MNRDRHFKPHFVITALLALATTAALAQNAPRAPIAPTPTSTSTSTPAAAPPSTALGCLIDASAIVEVGSSVIGVLQAVNVERGDTVVKGQVLAQLEAGVERAAVTLARTKVKNQADMMSARSQKDYADKKAVRAAELTALRFVSDQAREQADTEASMATMRVAQAVEQQTLAEQELSLARAQLAQRTIVSPLNGVVVERYTSVGERIENRPVLKLAQIDPLRVEVVLPAAQFNAVKIGHSARVLPELPGAKPLVATVSIVDKVVDAASNTFRARLVLPNRDLGVPSGVRCKVEFGS